MPNCLYLPYLDTFRDCSMKVSQSIRFVGGRAPALAQTSAS